MINSCLPHPFAFFHQPAFTGFYAAFKFISKNTEED
jgi:hypothetical protein